MFFKKTTRYIFLLVLFSFNISLCFSQGDTLKISGTVVDAATGQPIEGASVGVKGFSSALSGANGTFTVSIPNTKAILAIQAANYQYKELAVKGRSVVDAKMWASAPSSTYLTGNMVLTDKTKTNATNASSIVMSDIANTAESVEQLVQGKVPGLKSVLYSGAPGIGGVMTIRGYNSIFANMQPLIVVDGIILERTNAQSLFLGNFINPLATIDVKDIERITVIKDAASVYGAQAANGVIMIETTRAKQIETQIDFYAHGSYNMEPKQIPVMDAYDYRGYALEQFSERGYTSAKIAALPMMIDDPGYTYYNRFHNNTNWQDEVFRRSMNQNYYMKVSGGDPVARYSLSVGSSTNSGIIKNTQSASYFTQFNADVRTTQKLSVKTSFRFNYRNSDLYDDGNSRKYSPIYAALIKSPLFAKNIIDADGGITPNLEPIDEFGFTNPGALVKFDPDNFKQYKFLGSATFEYRFSDRFKVSSQIGIDFDKVRESIAIPGDYVENDTTRDGQNILYRPLRNGIDRLLSLFNDTRFSFNKVFNNTHAFNVDLGSRYKNSNYESDFGYAYNASNNQLINLQDGSKTFRQIGGSLGQWKSLAFYSSVDYKLWNKYMITLNGTLESSSRFGSEAKGVSLFSKKFGFFPSVSAAWLVSAEPFMAGVNAVELLKVRASYGLTGNSDIGNYNARAYYVPVSYMDVMGMLLGSVPNTELQWETTAKANLGLDASLFNERLTFSLDLYKHVTKDMLFPYTEGFLSDAYLINSASLENKGIEVSLNGRILKGAFTWDAGVVFSKNKNEVTDLPGSTDYISNLNGAQILTRKGLPLGVFYGYKTKGVFESNAAAADANLSTLVNNIPVAFKGGDVIFEDVKNDLLIDENDRQIIGDPNPDFFGSLTNNFNYKRLSLNVFVTYSVGNDVFNYRRSELESMSGMENQSVAIVNRWRTDGQVTDMPRASYGDPMGNSRFSDRWIEDGSYVRIKTITLGYDLPLKNKFFRNATVYASVNNLVTFTKYLGYNPEFSSSSSAIGQGIDIGLVPQFRSFFLGVKVGL